MQTPQHPAASVSSCLHRMNDGTVDLMQTKLEDMTPCQLEWARSLCDRLLTYLYPAEKAPSQATVGSFGLAIGMIEAGTEMIGGLKAKRSGEDVQKLGAAVDKLQQQWSVMFMRHITR